MKHLGDITKISGYDAPPVDVIIGGSPCQDLSIAGKRAGLDGARSGLFMEQIRIIKEMREKDARAGRTNDTVRPRFMVWENVPGAFSSNKGEDFRTVLEETAKIAEPSAVIPRPPNGKWTTAGCIMGDGWSIAWRVLDAQFWGVPQRRRRIALVADFGGHAAPEILFERESVSGDSAESRKARERTSGDAESGADCASCYCLQGNGIDRADTAGCNGRGWKEDVSYTLNTADRHAVATFRQEAYDKYTTGDIVASLRASGGNLGGGSETIVAQIFDARGNGDGETVSTLTGDHENRITDYTAIVCESVVRRLTPLECERLQGYPDGWTDIGEWTDSKGKKRKQSDSARYKALGNSIALPPWYWVLSRLRTYCTRTTMASLFDGIGGFPLIWETLCGKGSAVWCSEIEEFPIAVTKLRFTE